MTGPVQPHQRAQGPDQLSSLKTGQTPWVIEYEVVSASKAQTFGLMPFMLLIYVIFLFVTSPQTSRGFKFFTDRASSDTSVYLDKL